jgi:hypothetical protein
MNYKDFKKIKERLEVFEDASFFSFQGDDSIIIESPSRDLWSVPFSYKNDQLTLFGENAELVEKKMDIVEETINVTNINQMILEAASDKDDETYYEGLERLVDAFLFERKKSKTKKQKEMWSESAEDIELDIEQEDTSVSLWEDLDDVSKNFTYQFIESWEDKLQEVKQGFQNLFSVGFLFDNKNQFKSQTIYDPMMILEQYKEKRNKVDAFLENLSSLDEWYLKAEELGVIKESLDGISPLEKDWKTKLLKNLVLQKRKGMEIPIHETLSELENLSKEVIEESDMTMNIGLDTQKVPGSYNGENQMNFLKVNGVFTITDMERLISDFTRAMATYQASGLDRETVAKVSHYKDVADKMYRTNIIDDEKIGNMISDINTTFGPKKDSIYSPIVDFKLGSVA